MYPQARAITPIVYNMPNSKPKIAEHKASPRTGQHRDRQKTSEERKVLLGNENETRSAAEQQEGDRAGR